MKIERMLAAVIVLQVLILISQWTGQPSASTARRPDHQPQRANWQSWKNPRPPTPSWRRFYRIFRAAT